ncbi:MAG: DUF91 domain-containing protein, partial [Oscillospiraceae bacterium]|nr:DUF91 domain-containing protein [Oscillospiraceae bacterium]
MSEIKLFAIGDRVEERISSEVILEKELQNLIESNMEAFFGVRFLKSEYAISNGRMDSIGIDENNSPVIFEYKRSQNENVINQGLFYLDWLLDHKADFKLLVIDRLGMDAAEEIDWSVPCVFCIAHDFTKYDVHAVNQMQRNIRLVSYRKYDNADCQRTRCFVKRNTVFWYQEGKRAEERSQKGAFSSSIPPTFSSSLQH